MKQLQRQLISNERTDYGYGYEVNKVSECECEWFTFRFEVRYYDEYATEDCSSYWECSSELYVKWTDCLECIGIDCNPNDAIEQYIKWHKGKLNFHSSTTDEVCKELFKRSVIQDYKVFRNKCRSYCYFYLRGLYAKQFKNKDLGIY